MWVSPNFGENAGYPPGGGGFRFVGWVGGLLSLVDRQNCSWAEAHCDIWGCCHFVQTCFHSSLYMVLEQVTSGTVSDAVVIAQVSQVVGAASNPVVHH